MNYLIPLRVLSSSFLKKGWNIFIFQEVLSPPAQGFDTNSLSVLADCIKQSGADGLFNKVSIRGRFDKRPATANDA